MVSVKSQLAAHVWEADGHWVAYLWLGTSGRPWRGFWRLWETLEVGVWRLWEPLEGVGLERCESSPTGVQEGKGGEDSH